MSGTSYELLQARIEELEQELKNTDNQQIKAQKSKNHEFDQFVYRAYHDMAGPINTIQGLIQLIRMHDVPEEVNTYVKYIDNSASKLYTFIKSLNDYATVLESKVFIESVSFHDIINSALDNIRHIDGYQKIQINLNIPPTDQSFYSDFLILRNAFTNIISNAILYQQEAADDSYLNINIQKIGDNMEICFSDNGEGIEPHILPRVFDIFFRGNIKSKGSGIGLYVTKFALEKLQSKIWIEASDETAVHMIIPNKEELYFSQM